MLIGDGVTPGNEGRGYVLRRMLRRSVRSMRLLGYEDPCLPELLPVSLERMSNSYPELATGFDRIAQIAYAEEDAFRRTLASGTTILDTAVARTKDAGGSTLAGGRRPSRCTTPTASPSTSPWRWLPSRAWRSTGTGSPA
jgi:alanyl-tRNA synthetase